jgi:hypothetical protein
MALTRFRNPDRDVDRYDGDAFPGLGKYRLEIRSNEKFRMQSRFVAFYDPRHKPSAPAAIDSVEDTQGLDLRITSS